MGTANMKPKEKYQTYSLGTAAMYTNEMNIHARYPRERINEANASGILPLASNSSLGSIFQTDIEYHKVRKPEIKAHANGKPYSGQKQGTDPINNNRMQ